MTGPNGEVCGDCLHCKRNSGGWPGKWAGKCREGKILSVHGFAEDEMNVCIKDDWCEGFKPRPAASGVEGESEVE